MLQKFPLALSLLALVSSNLPLSAEVANDQILKELQALREQVSTLETRIAKLETNNAANASALESTDATNNVQPRERKSWFDTMRVELKKADVRASGAWTDPAAWDHIEVGLTIDEAIAALGEPTLRKFSVRKDTDEILRYQGDLEGTGELIEGEIRIYKGKIRRFSSPDFPSEN